MSLLDVPALLTLVSLGILYAVYAITWLFWYVFKEKNGLAIADSEDVFFSGGPKLIRNVVFLGIATSQLFTPSMSNELLIGPGLHMIVMLVSRIVAFLLCMFFWNHLAALRFRNMEEYLAKRFDSKVLIFLNVLNRIAGIYYIWCVYMRTYDMFRLFNVKSLVSFVHLMCAFGTLASLGGMNVVLVGCVILWLVGISGDIVLLHQTYPYMFTNSSVVSLKPDPCYSLVGPNCFLMIFGQILTVQPIYNIFQTANSIVEANIAMCIGLLLTILNTVISMCHTNGLLAYAARENVDPYNAVHNMFGYVFKRAELFAPRFLTQSQMDKAYEHVILPYAHFYVLLGTYVSNTIAFYLLQLHSVAMHTYLHLLPNWLRVGLVSDGRELHMTFSCLCILCAYLTVVLLIYSATAMNETSRVVYHMFRPYMSGMLMLPVTCHVMLAPLYPDLWSIPAVVTCLTVTLAGMIFSTQASDKFEQNCIAHWYPTIMFISSLTGNLILSAILRAPHYLPPGLLFKHHIAWGRKPEMGHALSVLSATSVRRTSRRTSFRLGTS